MGRRSGRVTWVGQLALARSGDKGATQTSGSGRGHRELRRARPFLTAEVVKEHFGRVCRGPVRRYELPGLLALNFILEDSLDGGGASSLRTDAQGKTFGQGIRFIELEFPMTSASRKRSSDACR